MIAKKREVAIVAALICEDEIPDGFSVERMSRDFGGNIEVLTGGEAPEMPGSVNLTASHCTNHISVCKKRGSQACDMSSEDGTFVRTGMTHTDECTVTTCRTIIL